MLKWLRKYNSFILVIGGVLLMVAWLLPETINQLGRTPFGAAPMRFAGRKVSFDRFDKATREYMALARLLPQFAQGMGLGENPSHWVLLTHEAEKAGLTGGKHDGEEFLRQAAEFYARMQLQQEFMFQEPPADRVDAETRAIAEQLTGPRLHEVMAETRLHADDIYRALGKLHGVARMRMAYMRAPRFSDRRLITGLKNRDDAATVDLLVVGPDQAMASIPEPSDAALQDHFEKYKTTRPSEGEFGIGYLLPDRVKIAWMTIDRTAIQGAITPDPVEVRKRFLRAYPTGQPPAGETEQSVMARFEEDVRREQTDRVLSAIDTAFKAEVEKAVRKLDTDGDYHRLPADWQAPDFERLREVLAQRVKEATGVVIPAPTVDVRAAEWMTLEQTLQLPGVGSSYFRRGNNTQMFPQVIFKVRELAGSNEFGLQVGVPSLEYTADFAGSRYYFMVLDARKESAPDSLDEVRQKVVADYKRLAAFEQLKGRMEELRQQAVSQGLESVAASVAVEGAPAPQVRSGVRVDGSTVAEQSVNTEEFRKAVLDAARKLDPLADFNTIDADQRTVAVALPRTQSIALARITAFSPVTVERFRSAQGRGILNQLASDLYDAETDPYSLKRLEERLNVKYLDGRTRAEDEAAADETESQTS